MESSHFPVKKFLKWQVTIGSFKAFQCDKPNLIFQYQNLWLQIYKKQQPCGLKSVNFIN